MNIIVLVSANAEWEAVTLALKPVHFQHTPYGDTFEHHIASRPLTFFHAGWGKAASAGGLQYVCDHYTPDLVVNLGTCGGIEGQVGQGEVVLVERAFMYDIVELMGDFGSVPAYYTTDLDLGWLPQDLPHPVRRATIASADSDLQPGHIPRLQAAGAIVADWESAALAWVARKNGIRLLILRAVSDLVGAGGGEAYGDHALYKERTRAIMGRLLAELPDWLEAVER
jgi:adenosylhomocysteine nucleosidase